MLNLYLFAIREHATQAQLDEMDRRLTPPLTLRGADGRPVGWGSDDDAWEEFAAQV